MQNKKKEIVFFDKLAEEKHDFSALSEKCFKRLFSELSKFLTKKTRNIKIIDLGCGTGNFTKKLSFFSNQIYGCDISRKSIERAKYLYPKIKFSVQDVINLSFANNSFDVVIFSGVLHHFNNLYEPLKEAKRILKKDGLIFSFDPNLKNPFFWLFRRKNSLFYSKKGVTENEEPLKQKEIENMMKLHNFNNIDVYAISNMPLKSVGDKKLSYFKYFYNFADYLLNLVPFIRNSIGSFLITKGQK